MVVSCLSCMLESQRFQFNTKMSKSLNHIAQFVTITSPCTISPNNNLAMSSFQLDQVHCSSIGTSINNNLASTIMFESLYQCQGCFDVVNNLCVN